MAAMLGEGSPEQPPVFSQDVAVAAAEVLEQPRGALDVGEQQRDCSIGQLRHICLSLIASSVAS